MGTVVEAQISANAKKTAAKPMTRSAKASAQKDSKTEDSPQKGRDDFRKFLKAKR